MEKTGVKEIKEVLDLVLGVFHAGQASLKDGVLSVADLGNLLPVLPLAIPAIEGISLLDDEFKDLSAEEAAEVVAHVAAKLAIENEKAKDVAVKSLKCALSVLDLVKAIAK